jgi:hypothetical protein
VIDRSFIAFSCFAHPVAETTGGVEEVLRSFSADRNVVSSRLAPESLRIPEQAHNQACQAVTVWEPKATPGSTMLVANLTDGWSSLVHTTATRFSLTCAMVRVSLPHDPWPIVELAYLLGGAERRFLRVMKDDPRWQFFERGDPLPFEEPSYYARRRIRDRLPRDLLFKYLTMLGWDPTDAGLWQSTSSVWEIRWAAA